jgi:hypothetical protein
MSNWFYEVDEKEDEFGGTIQLSANSWQLFSFMGIMKVWTKPNKKKS